MPEPYVHHIRPRYAEVDSQRVVFNAHYLTYCDDAADLWFRHLGTDVEAGGWDIMVKKATVTWSGGATVHDDLAIAVEVVRWGNTSFDVQFAGTVERSEEHTSELQSLMRISYAVFCLKKKKHNTHI